MSTTTQADILAETGAEILLDLDQNGTFPLSDRFVVGKAIHDAFVDGGWHNKLAYQFDIYRMKDRTSPHFWCAGRLDRICRKLKERGFIFRHLRDIGWKFLTQKEIKEWHRCRVAVTDTIIINTNEVSQVANENSPGLPIPILELTSKRIEHKPEDKPEDETGDE